MKATLAYLTMVGLPLIGLFAILDAGTDLEAPRHLGGPWALTSTGEAGGSRCALTPGARVTVNQSGGRAESSLTTTAGAIALHTRIGGGRFIARPGHGVDADCRGAVLKLLYEGETRIERMTGVWVPCAGCPPVQIVAQRVVTTTGE